MMTSREVATILRLQQERAERAQLLARLARRFVTLEREAFIREHKGLSTEHIDNELIDLAFELNRQPR